MNKQMRVNFSIESSFIYQSHLRSGRNKFYKQQIGSLYSYVKQVFT